MVEFKIKVIPVIIGAPGTISKSFRKTPVKLPGNTTSRSYSKQPHWALCAYFGQY
jgi:ribosomal protein L34E